MSRFTLTLVVTLALPVVSFAESTDGEEGLVLISGAENCDIELRHLHDATLLALAELGVSPPRIHSDIGALESHADEELLANLAVEHDANVVMSIFLVCREESSNEAENQAAIEVAILDRATSRTLNAREISDIESLSATLTTLVGVLARATVATPTATPTPPVDEGDHDADRAADSGERIEENGGADDGEESEASDEEAPAALPLVEDTAPPPPPISNERERETSRRAQLAINATMLGLALMAGVLFAADVQDPRLFAPILLLGGGGGLATSLLVDRRWPISRGDNSILGAGGWYGAAAGILVAGLIGTTDLRWLMTGSLIGETLGLTAGILAAAFSHVTVGDGAMLHTGAVWGLFTGGVIATLVLASEPQASFGMVLGGLASGLGVGVLLMHFVEVSSGRATVINLCGLLGILLGASVGIPLIIEDQNAGHLRAYAGILLGAAAAGLGLGVLLTRHWDERRRERRGTRRRSRARGTVTWTPTPTIIPPAPARGARAALGVQLIGGTW